MDLPATVRTAREDLYLSGQIEIVPREKCSPVCCAISLHLFRRFNLKGDFPVYTAIKLILLQVKEPQFIGHPQAEETFFIGVCRDGFPHLLCPFQQPGFFILQVLLIIPAIRLAPAHRRSAVFIALADFSILKR